jgi:hypothetical protein
MYANAPHASATTPPVSSLQHLPPQVQHGHPQGMPPAASSGGSHGISQAPAGAPLQQPQAQARPRQTGTAFMTGAYQSSGDPAIDRMLRLEAACKRFGSPL